MLALGLQFQLHSVFFIIETFILRIIVMIFFELRDSLDVSSLWVRVAAFLSFPNPNHKCYERDTIGKMMIS